MCFPSVWCKFFLFFTAPHCVQQSSAFIDAVLLPVYISVSVISVLRIVSLIHISHNDISYTLCAPLMWSIIEQELAIIAANLPLLRNVSDMTFLPTARFASRPSRARRSRTSAGSSESTRRQLSDVAANGPSLQSEQAHRPWSWLWENRDLEALDPLPCMDDNAGVGKLALFLLGARSEIRGDSARHSDTPLVRDTYPNTKFPTASGLGMLEPAHLP